MLQTESSSPILLHWSSLSSQIPVCLAPPLPQSTPPRSNIAPLSNPTRLCCEIFLKKNKSSKIVKNSQMKVGQRGPASRGKRFRFLVFLVGAANSRRLILEESESARSMSPFGGESCRSWWTVEDLARFASVARIAEANKSLKIKLIFKIKIWFYLFDHFRSKVPRDRFFVLRWVASKARSKSSRPIAQSWELFWNLIF